jgi:ATP-dependent RNA helicase DDX55/SPB4
VLACTDVMARGVDIPDVNWVVQFDPPSSASAFVHRCGRTARIGNKGNALLILLPTEESYVNFLKINQKAPVERIDEDMTVTDFILKVKVMAKKDRNFFEKGMRAYVSFVQSYSKHECRYLMKIKNLDFSGLATGFGLLKIPLMPELKGKDLSSFKEDEVNLNEVGYLDKEKEAKRKDKLKQWKETGENPFLKKKKKEKWSESKASKEQKKVKKEERKQKKKRKLPSEEEIKELSDDIKLLKKLKKGKIEESEFDKAFMDGDSDNDIDMLTS